jgi:hypothetical protein
VNCPQGCDEHVDDAGQVTCSGQPSPCREFLHSEDCSAQWGCSWK